MLVKNAFTVSWVSLSLSLSRSLSRSLSLSLSLSLCQTREQTSTVTLLPTNDRSGGQTNNSTKLYRVMRSEARPASSEAASVNTVVPVQHSKLYTELTLTRTIKLHEEFIPSYNTKSKWNRRRSSVLLHVTWLPWQTNELSVGSTLLQAGLVARFPDLCQCHGWVEPVEDAQR